MKARDILYLIAIILVVNLAFGKLFNQPHEVTSDNPADASILWDDSGEIPDDIESITPDTAYQNTAFQEEAITVSLPRINARSACVIDFDTGTILYEKNAYVKRPMASTTKIITAILAIENCPLDAWVPISGQAAGMGGSVMGLKAGTTVRMKDLLYGLLLCSGNDAAVAIAEYCAGSTQEFANMMNEKAREIGAYETHFINPHGLDAEDHYTTAYDLAKIARYALQNPIFNKIVQTREYSYDGRTLRNTNEMLELYEGADGVKTGYTGLAGRCLVTSATRNNIRLISVVLFCDSKSQRSQSSMKILDYAFENYGYVQLLQKGSIMGEVPVTRGRNRESIPAGVASSVKAMMKREERDMLSTKVSLPAELPAPVRKGSILGTVSVYKGDQIIGESSLIAMESVEKKQFVDYLNQVVDHWVDMLQ